MTNPHHLADHHRHQLVVGSGIPEDVLSERGYWTATVKAELKRLGFSDSQCNTPALVVPVRDVTGEIINYQIRPDSPRIRDGKPVKYESPAGSRPTIDVPARAYQHLGNPNIDLWITEGAKKADAAVARGLCCVSLFGVWGWRGRNADEGLTALADFESIALKGRTIVLAFDSDVMIKTSVYLALNRLTGFLQLRGAYVRFCRLSMADEKVGLDDYFVAGGTTEGLVGLVRQDLPEPPPDDHTKRVGNYLLRPSGITYLKHTKDGEVEVTLTNFAAEVVCDIQRDDGVTVTREFEVQATLLGVTSTFTVAADSFRTLDWVPQHLGARALVDPGSGSQARTPHAIQALSEPVDRTAYAHTGWRRIDGKWCFLHAGGALGSGGPVPGVEVTLSPQVAPCLLVEVDDVVAAVSSSLAMLDVAPYHVSVPLVLAAYRAPIGDCDISVYQDGQTGSKKTTVATLIQQHFGTGFDADHLPGNWTSTANAREELMFECKDIPCVLDDFVTAPGAGREKLDAAADRALRGVANHSARQRMNSDGSLRPPRPPRALPIVTGELIPAGHSLRARMVVVDMLPTDVDVARLTDLQKAAADGVLVGAMAGYVRWLAGQLEDVQTTFRTRIGVLRDELQGLGWHARTVMNVAQMIAAGEILLRFANEVGAIDTTRRAELDVAFRRTLIGLGDGQFGHLQDADPVEQYFVLLRAAIAGGLAYLRAKAGCVSPPGAESMCGWGLTGTTWSPRGQLIGYVESDSVYLIADLADKVAQELGRQRGEPLQLAGTTLRRRLDDRGLLASVEMRDGRRRLLRRVTIDGARQELLHLHLRDLLPSDQGVAQVAQSDAAPGGHDPSDGPPGDPVWPAVAHGEHGSGPIAPGPGPLGPQQVDVVAQHKSPPGKPLEVIGPQGPQAGRRESVLQGPATPCYSCKSTSLWCACGPGGPSGPWACSRCYPPATGTPIATWSTTTMSIDGAEEVQP